MNRIDKERHMEQEVDPGISSPVLGSLQAIYSVAPNTSLRAAYCGDGAGALHLPAPVVWGHYCAA